MPIPHARNQYGNSKNTQVSQNVCQLTYPVITEVQLKTSTIVEPNQNRRSCHIEIRRTNPETDDQVTYRSVASKT